MADAASARALLTEADVPPLPPSLPPDASDEAKAIRHAQMKERHRVQKKLREQERGDRPDRVRCSAEEESTRRTALRLFQAARRRPLPRVQETTFDTLWQLTKKFHDAPRNSDGHRMASSQLRAAWEAVLQRPCPLKVRREERLQRGRACACACVCACGLAADRGLSWTRVAIDSERLKPACSVSFCMSAVCDGRLHRWSTVD